METKLTLKLDKEVIKKAKEYASAQNRSLSRVVESYLKMLVGNPNSQPENEIIISDFVKSMRTGVRLPTDFNERESRYSHLEKKHQ